MSAKESKAQEQKPVEAQKVEAITLAEFCSRLSQTDKRVELIGAFHHVEVKAGRIKDSEQAFAARFGAFINKPV